MAMDQILSGLPGVQYYLDDILCMRVNNEEHLCNLDATLQRLEEYDGLRVHKDKCEFFQPSVEYLGHVIDAKGLHTSPSKITAIVDARPPQNVSQLRSFPGLLDYCGCFIPNIASLLQPLHELLRQDKTWKWTASCQETFQKSQDVLTASEVLTHFNPTFLLQLACDVSPYGVGAVISHALPNGEKSFASRTQNKAETKYAQLEREAFRIVFGVRKFHQHLYGRKFTLLTDQSQPSWDHTLGYHLSLHQDCRDGLCYYLLIHMTLNMVNKTSIATQMVYPDCLFLSLSLNQTLWTYSASERWRKHLFQLCKSERRLIIIQNCQKSWTLLSRVDLLATVCV